MIETAEKTIQRTKQNVYHPNKVMDAFRRWQVSTPNFRWRQWWEYCDLRDDLPKGTSRARQTEAMLSFNDYNLAN
jgi:hypothetical protein